MNEPSERMKTMVREMLKELRNDSRFNVMDYDSVDHLLTAIAELEQRVEKWKRLAVALHRADGKTGIALVLLRMDAGIAIEALGDEWTEAVK